MAPGLLYVTMQPLEGLSEDEFHDWYNNEHGPTRLRLPFVTNGFRYRAYDQQDKPADAAPEQWPEWVAIYDITDMAELKGEAYLRLRSNDVKSQREKETMAKIKVDRKVFDFVEEVKNEETFVPLEDLLDSPNANEEEPRFLNSIIQTVQPGQEEEFHKWYREEHMPMMSRIPGFLRIRRYKSSSIDPAEPVQWLSLVEWAKSPAGTPELAAMNGTPWRAKVQSECVAQREVRRYRHYYTFGGAPRDLAHLSNAQEFVAPDGLTKVIPAVVTGKGRSAIESYITTPDGADLHFRLEGATDQHAPLIVLSNAILTHYKIWDKFVDEFFAKEENRKYRILHYLTRGRTSKTGTEPVVTMDVLASDIVTILDTLRVKKAAAVIGVSLGGATALNTALRNPERVNTFIACDTNPVAPTANPKAWADRIAIAKEEGAVHATTGEPIVGQKLADVTVKRWFVPANYETSPNKERAQEVTQMVQNNSLAGFEKSAKALHAYDLRDAMKVSKKYGAFVIGSEDGILPQTMKDMAAMMGGEAEYCVIENAGHLPMVEQPEAFAEVVSGILQKLDS